MSEAFPRRKKGQIPDEKYIFERVSPEPNSGCWIWIGGADSNGYGCLNNDRAHRVSLSLKLKRPLEKRECACHKCDVTSCVNPDHLFVGSHLDNMRDCVKKGRFSKNGGPKGEKSSSAILTENDVRSIRSDIRSCQTIGRQYGVHKSTIWLIKKRKNWGHLND